MPKYAITVQLSGIDGNAAATINAVMTALKRARVPQSEIEAFQKEATSGDYDHVFQTAMSWVNVT